MTAFELVFALVTIITSLALTHLLAGFVEVLRNAERVQFSWPHALWAWAALFLAIGNWASFWELRSVTSWPAWAVLLSVAVMVLQYLFCAFVTPDTTGERDLDLVDFHHRERRRYSLAAVVLFALALILNALFGGAGFYSEWLRDSLLSFSCLSVGLFAYFISVYWMQVLSAALIAILATFYAIITCNVVAA